MRLISAQGEFRVGTSGYQYDHWNGIFYPEDIPKKHWFEFYAKNFDSVEINNTFYNLPARSTFENWRDRAPEGFCYVLKFSRYGSHIKKLKNPEDSAKNFLDRAEVLGTLLGPILVQLPPRWHSDAKRLEQFLDYVPGRRRWALEFRDPTWLSEETYQVLRDHNAALCIHDLIEDHPEVTTADWVYFRFHGGSRGDYSYQFLSAWAKKMKNHLSDGKDVFAFFNNDAHGYALSNAKDLRRYVTGEEN